MLKIVYKRFSDTEIIIAEHVSKVTFLGTVIEIEFVDPREYTLSLNVMDIIYLSAIEVI